MLCSEQTMGTKARREELAVFLWLKQKKAWTTCHGHIKFYVFNNFAGLRGTG